MTGPFADRLFRIAFVAAGIYNLAFGLWASVWPLAFFELFAIPPPRYPGIWACLGMVVGLYGLLYLYAAWKLEPITEPLSPAPHPERGRGEGCCIAWPIIAVGLLGKVLGPIGMAMSFGDDWPRRVGMICVYNDLVWWLPFALFLVRGTAFGKRIVALAPWLCAATHLIAIAMLATVLRHGGLTEPDIAARSQFIATHPTAWTFGWVTWMVAAATLVGFYAWWGSQLRAQHIAIAAVLITAIGMVFDFSGESLLVLLLVERASAIGENAAAFGGVERAFTLLSAGAANGLYTLGGVLLTLATPDLPRRVRSVMWGTWVAGAAMTMAAVVNSIGGMTVSAGVLFSLLLVWIVWMGARWEQTLSRSLTTVRDRERVT